MKQILMSLMKKMTILFINIESQVRFQNFFERLIIVALESQEGGWESSDRG